MAVGMGLVSIRCSPRMETSPIPTSQEKESVVCLTSGADNAPGTSEI
jgi:hypothetical protein